MVPERDVTLFDEMLDAVEFSSLRRLVLDLERLSFIDARGLRGVLRLHATCLTQSVELTIKRGPKGVQRLFELTHTDRLLPFAPPGAEDRSD
jgi:anti-anti-sigma factor